MDLLVRTPTPHATESLWGYTLRVSEANGYSSPWHVLTHACLGGQAMKGCGFSYEKLAKILGRSASELAPLSYNAIVADGKRHFCILGQSLGKTLQYSPFKQAKPSFCPHCVMEEEYLDAFWDLGLSVACPKHRCTLVEKCGACGEALSWFRPGLLTCKCGASLMDAPTHPVEQPLVDLMSLLQAKVHAKALSETSNAVGLPTQHLANLSLRSLIIVLFALGNFSISGRSREPNTDLLSVAGGAAGVLMNWPYGYYNFLRRIGAKTDNKEAATLGLRKRFEGFYSSMFKGRTYGHEMQFLRDEFVRFGLEEWGESIVGTRMKRGVVGTARFVSAQHYANLVGIRPITLRRWARSGKIPLREVATAEQKRFIADLKKHTIPKKAPGKIFETRAAAAYIGLPVSALKALRDSGHYAVTHMAIHMPGYHEGDLQSLREKLLSHSRAIEKIEPGSNFVTLNDIMQHLQFWSESGKANFLIAYLQGEIRSIGRTDSNIGQIYFRKADIEQYISASRESASRGAISQREASKLIDCDYESITGLINAGYLEPVPGPERTRVVRVSVANFAENYVSLSRLAKEGDTSSTRLARLASETSIPMLSYPRKAGSPVRFIRCTDLEKLLTQARKNPVRKQARPY